MKTPVTAYETYLNYLTIALVVGLIALTGYGLFTLPDRIPVHFNMSGKPDRWGGPENLLILLFLSFFIIGLLWVIRTLPPEFMNFPGLRTPDNVARQMQNTWQLLATMRAVIALLFLGLMGQWINTATADEPRRMLWLPLVFVALLLGSVAVFVVRAYRL